MRSRLPALAGMLFMALFTVGVIWLVKDFISNAEPPEKTRVQKISLVKPPPPKPQEKPPEPEKMEQEQTQQEEVQLEAPSPDQPADEGPPPGEQLGLDADGGSGSDGFGLADIFFDFLNGAEFKLLFLVGPAKGALIPRAVTG